jgi:hypothetical protein
MKEQALEVNSVLSPSLPCIAFDNMPYQIIFAGFFIDKIHITGVYDKISYYLNTT